MVAEGIFQLEIDKAPNESDKIPNSLIVSLGGGGVVLSLASLSVGGVQDRVAGNDSQ